MNLGFQEFFSQAANGWLQYILALNLIGAISMAILQTVKDLFPIRRTYQKWRLQIWFRKGAERLNAGKPLPVVSDAQAENELLILAANGDGAAFFDQQIEQVCGVFNAAMQVVLESPLLYGDLLKITASRADPTDVAVLAAAPPSPMTKAYLDARNRVLHNCQRSIGAFQVDCDYRWKWWMQISAMVVSTLLSWTALSYGAVTTGATQMAANGASVVVTSLLAGFLAPVGKDLLAVLQRARGQ
jgi:hypothetical protein